MVNSGNENQSGAPNAITPILDVIDDSLVSLQAVQSALDNVKLSVVCAHIDHAIELLRVERGIAARSDAR